jgi:propanol-preferring alcohol dehydrogenase
MRALQLTKWNSRPEIVERDIPVAGPGQVVVKIGGAGLCHSDLHVMNEFVEGMLPWQLPFTLGHENAGWVHELGAGVSGLEVGQPVAVYGPWGCGHCARCLLSAENYCERPSEAPVLGGGGGLGLNGGLAQYMLVPAARHLVALPDGMDPVHAAPLTDAGLTPYHAIRRSWSKLTPGSHAVVIGVGGLGHLAVQILKATTATRVIAVDTRTEALELATREGADVAVQVSESAVQQIRGATRGVGADVVLDFVGNQATVALGSQVARVMGDLTIVGIGGGSLGVSFFSVPYELSIQTTYWGSRSELVEVLDLASRGLLRPTITQLSLDDAVDAYERMERGDVVGRQVVVPT